MCQSIGGKGLGAGGRRRRGWQRMRWLDGITDSMDMGFSRLRNGDGQRCLACCDSWGHRVGHDWVTELNWTECVKVISLNTWCILLLFSGRITICSKTSKVTQIVWLPINKPCNTSIYAIVKYFWAMNFTS